MRSEISAAFAPAPIRRGGTLARLGADVTRNHGQMSFDIHPPLCYSSAAMQIHTTPRSRYFALLPD